MDFFSSDRMRKNSNNDIVSVVASHNHYGQHFKPNHLSWIKINLWNWEYWSNFWFSQLRLFHFFSLSSVDATWCFLVQRNNFLDKIHHEHLSSACLAEWRESKLICLLWMWMWMCVWACARANDWITYTAQSKWHY